MYRQLPKRLLATSAYSRADTLSKYPIGLKLHGYSIQQVQPIDEFSIVAVKLKHDKTGLEHLHLDAPTDKNNVFLIALKTNPPDATGVPHILEHTTLCGSHKYPVRDPFFKMLNRSLSNFMNAMTGHDYTYYPFATTNPKDFDNLMDVYLSSVFEPLLTYQDFMQEGWRLEQKDITDAKSPIEFKGVVYNEMKGNCSNSSYLFWIKFQEAIYASLNNSGGDPSKITDLQYEDLIDFHAKNYHPSNARTFTYGNFPLIQHLEKLNSFYGGFGKRMAKLDVKKPIFELKPSDSPYLVEVSGPVDTMSTKPPAEQFKSSITWYLGNPLDESKQYELFKWKALSTLLLDGHSAPFYQELIETGYGEDFSANVGLDLTTAMTSFSIGLNNLSREKVDALPNKVNEILTKKVLPELEKGSNSIFNERVEAILHQLELSFKKHKPDFGLGLLSSLVPSWVNGLDPVNNLRVERILLRFKDDYENEGLKMFTEMLRTTLLNDSAPQFRFTMTPDEQFNEKTIAEENGRLERFVGKLDEEDKKIIFDRSQALLEKQQEEEDVSVLPTLTVNDIARKGDFHELAFSPLGSNGNKIQKRVTNTNDLVYVTAAKDLAYLPSELYKYMPVFNTCLLNLNGTKKNSITEIENKIQKTTGGISFSTSAKTDPFNIGNTKMKFVMSGMALKNNSENIYDLWYDIVKNTKFESEDTAVVDKLAILIKNLAQNQLNMIADRGHSYANAYSNAQLTPTKYINDVMGGIEQVKLVAELNEKLDSQGKDFLKTDLLPILKSIQEYVVSGRTTDGPTGFNYNIVADQASVSENEGLIEKFDSKITDSESKTHGNALADVVKAFTPGINQKTILNAPFGVGYAALANLGSGYNTKDGATLQVLSQLMTFKHLHSVIREANGAYGGGLSFDGLGGTLNFFSYRDPNAIDSVKAFENAANVAKQKLESGKWTEKDLQEAKLAIFQSVDAPSHVSSQGSLFFLEGISDEMRQERRERFLDVTLQDLQEVNEKYLVNAKNNVATVIGDAGSFGEAANSWDVKNLS